MKSTILIIDTMKYGNNAGTIVRMAALFNVNKIHFTISSELVDFKNDKTCPFRKNANNEYVYKSTFRTNIEHFSTQHSKYIKLIYNENIRSTIDDAITNGFHIFVAENDLNNSIYTCDMKDDKVAIILGNETFGVSKIVREYIKNKQIESITIPSLVDIGSFNVAQAASILIYERIRQIQSKKRKYQLEGTI